MDNGASSYRRFLDGDDNGIVEIVRDYKDGLILFLTRYAGSVSLAEELAEDTFFRLVTRRPRFTARYSFKTWLYTIGRNTALNHLRRAGYLADVGPEALENEADETAELERACIREEDRRRVHRALSCVREDYGRTLYLKYFEDMDNREIGAVLGKSRRQVENLLYQAKRALRSELEKEGFIYEEL